MATIVFNIAKGALVEKFRDGSANGIVLLLEAVEADAALADHDNLQDLLNAAGNTESTSPGYSRKTGVVGTIVVDDTNDEVTVDIPDQTWFALTGNSLAAVIIAYEESASDAGRVPLTKHDFVRTLDGSDVQVRFP